MPISFKTVDIIHKAKVRQGRKLNLKYTMPKLLVFLQITIRSYGPRRFRNAKMQRLSHLIFFSWELQYFILQIKHSVLASLFRLYPLPLASKLQTERKIYRCFRLTLTFFCWQKRSQKYSYHEGSFYWHKSNKD